jgi:two-component system chemotaxis response regulator CheB
MDALPRELFHASGPFLTGITCPECAGTLEAFREGNGNLRFACRVGHTLSVDELLEAKEEKSENDFWALVRGLEELLALLVDLEAYARHDPRGRIQMGGPHHERIAQARDHVGRLRAILQEKRPVDLTQAGDASG